MAIKKTVEYKGIEITDAYCKVWRIDGNKEFMNIRVSFSKDELSEPIFSKGYNMTYDLDRDNVFVQAYKYLKTLDEFKDAEDC